MFSQYEYDLPELGQCSMMTELRDKMTLSAKWCQGKRLVVLSFEMFRATGRRVYNQTIFIGYFDESRIFTLKFMTRVEFTKVLFGPVILDPQWKMTKRKRPAGETSH